jgi:hypothetical protein
MPEHARIVTNGIITRRERRQDASGISVRDEELDFPPVMRGGNSAGRLSEHFRNILRGLLRSHRSPGHDFCVGIGNVE